MKKNQKIVYICHDGEEFTEESSARKYILQLRCKKVLNFFLNLKESKN
ncbi:hypothetical protein Q7A53_13570 [Halobacillus rhizosphaerae]